MWREIVVRKVTYLIDYAFTFTFASWEFPPTYAYSIVRDIANRPGDFDL